jgi:putative Mn2+ efflux pump MntP
MEYITNHLDLLTYGVLAIGLAMDAFAVSIARGATLRCGVIHHAFLLALVFGVFQAVMPLIGWLAGNSVTGWITGYGYWIAAALLFLIGGRMIVESGGLETECPSNQKILWSEILLLAVATSIDALVIGVSFALLKMPPLIPILIIGIVTFVFSFAGVILGERGGHLFESKIEVLGGLVLIAIGIKILLEQTFF